MTMLLVEDPVPRRVRAHTPPVGAGLPTNTPAAPVQRIGMWDQEREHPWRYAGLYAAAMLAGLLGHHVVGWVLLLAGPTC